MLIHSLNPGVHIIDSNPPAHRPLTRLTYRPLSSSASTALLTRIRLVARGRHPAATMSSLSLVVAANKNWGIGVDGGIPWRLPGVRRRSCSRNPTFSLVRADAFVPAGHGLLQAGHHRGQRGQYQRGGDGPPDLGVDPCQVPAAAQPGQHRAHPHPWQRVRPVAARLRCARRRRRRRRRRH